jgi:TetR/AcrR family transcriptional repressor of nem operon
LRYPADHKAKTHTRILETACLCFRERGIKDVSIAEVMSAAELTHGGFYSHFKSKDALVAEVIRHGLDESLRYIERWGHGVAKGGDPLTTIINNYLSRRHRDDVGSGCPLPLLSPEIARGSATAKRAFDDKIKEIIAALGEFIARDSASARDTTAITLLATIVGGMLLARATGDADYSDWILQACRQMLAETMVPHSWTKTRRVKRKREKKEGR